MTTAVSGSTRGEAHAGRSGTIALAAGGGRPLGPRRAPAPPRNVPRPRGAAAPRHLPAAPSAATRRSVHRKNGILQILLWEAELGSDHCQREERGRRLLKQQRPLRRSLLARSWERGAEPGGGLGGTRGNLTSQRAPPPTRPTWRVSTHPANPNASSGSGVPRVGKGSFPPRPPPGAPRSLGLTPGVGKPKGTESRARAKQDRSPPGSQLRFGVSFHLREVLLLREGKPATPPPGFSSQPLCKPPRLLAWTNLLRPGLDATSLLPTCLVLSLLLLLLRLSPLLLLGSRRLLSPWNKGFPWKLLQWFPPALK